MRVVVLGGGRVGGTIAQDLVAEDGWGVTVADVSRERLDELAGRLGVRPLLADLSDPAEVRRVAEGFDLAVGAVPGPMGFATVAALIEARVPVVDISFFEEDPFRLDRAARTQGVPVLVDCGVSPGCGNLILGHVAATFEAVERFTCYVGGLPVERRWPYEYRAVFSPIDVIAEYTRPARLVEHGEVVVRPALSELELMDFAGVGTLEAFNSDGLRTLVTTMPDIPFMKEKTLRYPGHAERMRMLRDTGFFGEEPVAVGDAKVCPLDLTARLLFPAWQLQPGEEDLTVMRVEVEGRRGGRRIRRSWDLLDRLDPVTGATSMARTTGYTCSAVVRAMAAGLWSEPGVAPPEVLGRSAECYRFVMDRLAERNVLFHEHEEELAD